MHPILALPLKAQALLNLSRHADFLAPLLLRLYLAPVFWVAGTNKLAAMDDTIAWFGNPDWGLGLPLPALMAWLATLTETVGAALLVLGLGTRWISLPLMITMLVAAFTVHWQHGWQAIADPNSPFPPANIEGAMERLTAARSLLLRDQQQRHRVGGHLLRDAAGAVLPWRRSVRQRRPLARPQPEPLGNRPPCIQGPNLVQNRRDEAWSNTS